MDESSGFLKPELRYFLQAVFCYPAILLAGAPFSALLSLLGFGGEHPSHTHFAGYEGIVCLFVGITSGWTIGRQVPSLVPSGRWIWVLPAIVVFPDMVREGFRSQPVPWLPGDFFATPDNEGLGVFLFRLPTLSAVGYSIGMALVGTKPTWARLTHLSPLLHAVTVITAWFVVFALLALFAHGFERSRIEKWSRVRTVIDRPGLSLSADANQLCSTPTSSGGLLLPSGTMVEGLERRFCFNRRVLDEDVPRPTGSWSVERVKVLTGANGGAEGWVLTYGLLEKLRQ
jgi:hypothetical protein